MYVKRSFSFSATSTKLLISLVTVCELHSYHLLFVQFEDKSCIILSSRKLDNILNPVTFNLLNFLLFRSNVYIWYKNVKGATQLARANSLGSNRLNSARKEFQDSSFKSTLLFLTLSKLLIPFLKRSVLITNP